MEHNYWSKVISRRIGRRRAIAIGGSFTAAAAFLAACGGDDDDPPSTGGTGATTGTGSTGTTGSTGSTGGGGSTGSTAGTGATSGLVAQPMDTTSSATRNGVLKDYAASEPQTLDPISPVAPLNALIRNTYGALLTEEPGHLTASPGVLRGDMAESWEISPDGLEVTMKLRQGVTFHNKPPVDGREVDVDDVLFSWRRYTELSPFRELAYNGANPEAPILSMEAADPTTLLIKLKEPVAYTLRYFGIYGSQSGNMMIVPKEADGGYDLRHEMIGHGPFALTEAVPAVGYTFKRHETYYDKDFALVEQIDMPIVPEYAARVAQFKAGNIHRLIGNDPLGEDVVVIKQDEPDVNVYQTAFAASPWILIFGQLPAGESPFLDERVRQAFSMAIDRKAWIDVLYNVDGFEREGLPVEARWNSHLLSSWDSPSYWLDPEGSEFGPNAKYFAFNPEEATKLLTAAGHENMSATSSYPVERLVLTRFAEPIDGMLRNIGIEVTVNTPDYATVYIPTIRDGKGQFEGWGYGSVTGVMPQALHPASSLAAEYWPKGGIAFRGFSTTPTPLGGDPALTTMIEKARLEFDDDALLSQVHDIQRYLAEKMYGLNMPGGASGFTTSWPALQNVQVWNHRQSVAANANMYQLWIDETKAPFA